MSITIMSAVWPLQMSSTDKIVLLALADAANDEEGHTWIAIRSKDKLRRDGQPKLNLLVKTSLSERAIQLSIKRLEEAGHITREERPGKGVDYWIHPARPPHDVRPAPDAPPHQMRGTPAPDAPKSSITPIIPPKVAAGAKKTLCPDDFWPAPVPGTKTHERTTALIEQDRLTEQVEKFVAHHQTRENKFVDWQKCWTTWVTNNFDGKANYRGNTSVNNQLPTNPMVRAAVKREAGRRNIRVDGPGDRFPWEDAS